MPINNATLTQGQPVILPTGNDKALTFNFQINPEKKEDKHDEPDWLSGSVYLASELFLQTVLAANQPVGYALGAAGGLLGKCFVNKNFEPMADIPQRLQSGAVAFSKSNRTEKLLQLALKIAVTYAATKVFFDSFGPLYAIYSAQSVFGDLSAKDVKKMIAPSNEKLTVKKE